MKRYIGKIPSKNKWVTYYSGFYDTHYFDYDKTRYWFEQALILYFPMQKPVHGMLVSDMCESAQGESIYMDHIIKCFKKIQKQINEKI